MERAGDSVILRHLQQRLEADEKPDSFINPKFGAMAIA
jgi:hypothetical protein